MVSETPAAGPVCIVGAGPGPADLMTLRALNRLQQAQVVVHDRLIAEDVLALIPASARRVYVGRPWSPMDCHPTHPRPSCRMAPGPQRQCWPAP
jgi:siroheme synthase